MPNPGLLYDRTKITSGWLKSVGFRPDGTVANGYVTWLNEPEPEHDIIGDHIRLVSLNGPEWYAEIKQADADWTDAVCSNRSFETRGEALRLFDALGVKIKEPVG